MKQYNFQNTKLEKIAFGVFLFLMLILARDTLFTSLLLGFYKAQFLSIGLMGISVLFFLVANRKRLKEVVTDRRILVVITASAIVLIPMLVKRDWQLMYFSILLCIYFAIFLTYFVSCRDVARYYVVIIALLGVYGIFATHVLNHIAEAGILNVPAYYNGKSFTLRFFGLAFASNKISYIRNFGIFREPGVHQYFVFLAIYLNNYTVQWKTRRALYLTNVLLVATMLSTFAAGGMVQLALFALIVFFDKEMYKNKRARIAVAVGIAVAIAAVGLAVLKQGAFYRTIVRMVSKLFTLTDSTSARLDTVVHGVTTFLKSPVFGSNIATVLHGVVDNTSSTLILLGFFGIMGGLFHVTTWVALVWKKEHKLWVNLMLLMTLFMSFNTQNLTWDVFFWLFPVMALVERGLPLVNLEKNRKKG